jgi:hypothetical protein
MEERLMVRTQPSFYRPRVLVVHDNRLDALKDADHFERRAERAPNRSSVVPQLLPCFRGAIVAGFALQSLDSLFRDNRNHQ